MTYILHLLNIDNIEIFLLVLSPMLGYSWRRQLVFSTPCLDPRSKQLLPIFLQTPLLISLMIIRPHQRMRNLTLVVQRALEIRRKNQVFLKNQELTHILPT